MKKNPDIYQGFNDFVSSENLLDSGKILLGISGGIDSMVMLGLFLKTGLQVSAAHCNFGLRGQESDTDQVFVAEYCKKNNVPLHTKHFNTQQYAEEHKISLQMAARDLRYSWFEHLKTEHNYSSIAIAHNKNDLAETFLLNLTRGTGIRGLSGISAKTGNVIRPLLFAGRKEILEYAEKHAIPFREDSSNKDIKYRRNRIRHKIIPEFEAILPGFTDTLFETAKRLKDVETIYSGTVNRKFDDLCIKTSLGYKFNIRSLLSLNPLPTYLYEFLKRWNFPRELVPDIIASLSSSSGKQFFSPTHRLIRDRDYLFITMADRDTPNKYYIEEDTTGIAYPVKMNFTRTEYHPGFIIPRNTAIACLDQDLLHFPLILRKWQKGDYFQPLGMTGLKKLSDFFIDNKLTLIEKEKTWIMASGNKVVWIVGHRIDNRFKISERTRNILLAEMIEYKG